MSSGFSGSSTRSMKDFEREVESRMKRLDRFSDDYDVPSKAFKEVAIPKSINGGGEYQKPHDDHVPEADTSFVHMELDSNENPGMDALDNESQRYQSRIKDVDDQFPGVKMSENKFHKEVERRMKRLGKGDVVTTQYKGFVLNAADEGDGQWYCFVSKGGRVVYELKDIYMNAKSAIEQAKREVDAGNAGGK